MKVIKKSCFFGLISFSSVLFAAEYSASFKNTDIQEFINTVSHNLDKTIIVDPSIKGSVNVRSYDLLNDEQYYQFFLSVLDVYGFAVVPMPSGVLKVVKATNAKTSAIPVADDVAPGSGDEVVTRVVPVRNVSVRDLAPLLRQLNDNAGVGNVVHYEPSNVLLLTGRAAVVNRLVEIIHRVDKVGDESVDIIKLQFASASEMVRLITALTKNDKNNVSSVLTPKLVADERTNAVVISGDPQNRQRIVTLIWQLDREQQTQGNTRVFYLKYAKAKNLVDVLSGTSKTIQNEKNGGTGTSTSNTTSAANTSSGAGSSAFNGKDLSIVADEQTNALVITAQPDVMQELERIIAKLDIRRAQVLVEAIIVEVQDGDALNLGVQWANTNGAGTQFTATGLPTSTVANAALEYKDHSTFSSTTTGALGSFNGLVAGMYSGNWAGLVTALSSNTKSNILATPSIVTLDNKEAAFNVGQEVPVISGSQSSTSGSVFNTVERKTIGTKLKVTPQINEGDSVQMEIEQEVSSVASSTSSDSSSSASLGSTFNTRTVKNTVLVKSGETVVLGGLLNNTTAESVYEVPLLSDIPVLGYLFRYSGTTKSKQNLMVFIHPTILRDPVTYNGISSSKYNLFRAEQLSQEAETDRLALPVERPILPAYGTEPTLLSPKMKAVLDKSTNAAVVQP
ncbi:type II secretion system secretin GspD [uncultured Tolumonas sp.]|uniref:type II secretion system secretin GspD n=1 Tax=uncultured Tolumonas sp. TaxID=263765 RepID=UPI002A0A8A48|nr:type II secretion system secretin GspD [uncultured Tolumonas sp.]